MTTQKVRAVTAQVSEHRRGLQFFRDADGYDLEQDSRWEDVDPSGFYPDERLEGMRRRPLKTSPNVGA